MVAKSCYRDFRIGVASLVCLAAVGCGFFRIVTSQTVVLNGHRLVFKRLDSLRPIGDEPITKLVYDDGDFTIVTRGDGILANGFEIRTTPDGVQIHNQPFELSPGDIVYFDRDMEWVVESAAGQPAAEPSEGSGRAVPASASDK